MENNILCSICSKEMGIVICCGCNSRFCYTHIIQHHQSLETALNAVVQMYNTFQEEVKRREHITVLENAILSQIDDWHDRVIEQINQLTEQTRTQVKEFLFGKIKDVEVELQDATKEVQKHLDTKNYHEQSIKLSKEKLKVLTEKFSRISVPPSIKLNTEQTTNISWNSLIYVETNEQQTKIRCPSSDINCIWRGLPNELDDHLKTCAFKSVRLKIERLTKQIQEQNSEIQKYQFDNHTLKEQVEQLRVIDTSSKKSKINKDDTKQLKNEKEQVELPSSSKTLSSTHDKAQMQSIQTQPDLKSENDADRKQRTKLVLQTIEKLFIDRISPEEGDETLADVWPIEQVWGILKEKIRGEEFPDVEHLNIILNEKWKKISPDDCKKMIDSIPKKLRDVINRGGTQI